jgi:undecaprenyl-diphosphatase
MTDFEAQVLAFLNHFAGRSIAADTFAVLLTELFLAKGGALMALLWWGWFAVGCDADRRRQTIPATLIGCFVALAMARLLALALPFRPRPIHNPALGLRLPHDVHPATLLGWSSFPSDHAALFTGLASGIGYFAKRIGALAMAYVLVLICLPRLYLGFHYPTDIVAGALLGIGSVMLMQRSWIGWALVQPIWQLALRSPGLFYAGLFLLSFEITVTLYDVHRGACLCWTS